MTAGETGRLAALERTLVGAAARQAQRRRYRRRRMVVTLAVAAPLLLAVAGSVASTQGLFSVDRQFSVLRDDRLIPLTPLPSKLSDALGALPRDQGSRRSWVIAGRRVTGYTTRGGSFCFVFGPLTGGCVQPREITAANPVSLTVDFGPATLRLYGLASDAVTGISLRARGMTRPVLVMRNALYFSDGALGGGREFTGTLIVRLRGGAVQRLRIHVSGGDRPSGTFQPIFPGSAPAGDTAA